MFADQVNSSRRLVEPRGGLKAVDEFRVQRIQVCHGDAQLLLIRSLYARRRPVERLMRCLLAILCSTAGTATRRHGYGQQFSIEAKRRAVPVTEFDGVSRHIVRYKGATKPHLAAIRTA